MPFRLMPIFLRQLKKRGFTGVQNFPTVGPIDGNFWVNLETALMSYDKDIENIARAQKPDLLSTRYVFSTEQAIALARAGENLLVAHVA